MPSDPPADDLPPDAREPRGAAADDAGARPGGVSPDASTRAAGVSPEAPTRGATGAPSDAATDDGPLESWDDGETRRWERDLDGLGNLGALLHAGATVDHFAVLRSLGQGGMGAVYLARDTRLGRKVALKVLSPEAIGSPEALERFLFEARATARFAHPHIVTVYAVGEHHGLPYLAMEYLQGQTLRGRMMEAALPRAEVLRIALAIADALAEAHRHQILHRDLKPDNVMIPRDGRIRVLDFGLATVVRDDAVPGGGDATASVSIGAGGLRAFETRGGGPRGTPPYMAPEQWRVEACTGATDVWALGVMLYELVVGELPFWGDDYHQLCHAICRGEPRRPLPADDEPLAALIRGCLDKDPSARPSIDAVVAALADELAADRPAAATVRSPFRGLLPFDERHAGGFFGRDAELGAFLERLRDEPVLPVVGPSGAGKSSFVAAGVVPRLLEQGPWLVLRLRPGRRPLRALAARLLTPGAVRGGEAGPAIPPSGTPTGAPAADALDREEQRLRRALSEAPARLALELHALARRADAQVLLFVDQLEELDTLVDDASERAAFVEALCSAADDALGPVRVVFTLRDDVLGRLALGPASREALGRVTVLRAPADDTLREILERQVAGAGYGFDDPALVDAMVDEVRGEPAALPMLQFAGEMLWAGRDRQRRQLRRARYEAMGGVAGALAHHADGVLAAMGHDDRGWARELLLRLVAVRRSLGGGAAVSIGRRVLPRGELLRGLPAPAGGALDRLIAGRLVIARQARGRRGEGAADDADIELVHESLLRSWARLARWIEATGEQRAFAAELAEAAALWDRRGRRPEELWSGDALRDGQRRAAALEALEATSRAFLDEAQRRERRRARRRRGAVAGVFAAVLIVAAVLGWQAHVAGVQRDLAEQGRATAERKRAEALREGARNASLRGDRLEARARVRESLELADSPLARALWWRLRADPLRWERRLRVYVREVDITADGSTVAATSYDAVFLYDAHTRELSVLRGTGGQLGRARFVGDGRRVAVGSHAGEVAIHDLASGAVLRQPERHGDWVAALAPAPDGSRIASGALDGRIHVWDLADAEASRWFDDHADAITDLAWSADGRWLVSASEDGALRVRDLRADAPPVELATGGAAVMGLAVDPNGRRLAGACRDARVRIWSLDGGPPVELVGHTAPVRRVAFRPDGRSLASAGADRDVLLWPAGALEGDGSAPARLRGHGARVTGLRFAADGHTLVSSDVAGALRVWEPRRASTAPRDRGHATGIETLALAPDGAVLATAGHDGDVWLWDPAGGAPLRALEGHGEPVMGVAFSADGRWLASASHDRSVRIWDRASGQPHRVLLGHDDRVSGVAFHPAGDRLVSVGLDRTLRWWDPVDGVEIGRWSDLPQVGRELAFSPDGATLAICLWDGRVQLRAVTDGRLLRSLDAHRGGAAGVAFSPDGRWLLTGGLDGGVRLWPVAGGPSRPLGELPGRVWSVAFAPDGARVAAACSDHRGYVWSLDGGEPAVLAGHRAEVNAIRFTPAGDAVLTAGDDGTLRRWDPADGRPLWRPTLLAPSCTADARGVLTRDDRPGLRVLMDDLRRALVHGDGCLALADDGALRHVDATGAVAPWGTDVTAIERDGAQVLAAVGASLAVLDGGGETAAVIDVDPGASAVARVGRWFALGYPEGTIELVPADGDGAPRALDADDVPMTRVERILAGPGGTLVAGHADGWIAVYGLDSGAQLRGVRLHGPVVSLRRDGATVHAVSELGDAEPLDLSVFERDYCELLDEIWSDVGVVWEAGHAVERPPPAVHGCR